MIVIPIVTLSRADECSAPHIRRSAVVGPSQSGGQEGVLRLDPKRVGLTLWAPSTATEKRDGAADRLWSGGQHLCVEHAPRARRKGRRARPCRRAVLRPSRGAAFIAPSVRQGACL